MARYVTNVLIYRLLLTAFSNNDFYLSWHIVCRYFFCYFDSTAKTRFALNHIVVGIICSADECHSKIVLVLNCCEFAYTIEIGGNFTKQLIEISFVRAAGLYTHEWTYYCGENEKGQAYDFTTSFIRRNDHDCV